MMIKTALATLAGTALLVGGPAYASHGSDDGPGHDQGDDHGHHHGHHQGDDDHGHHHGHHHGDRGNQASVRTGSCSDGARWKLKVKGDDGGLEVEAEVDSNAAGQAWTWSLSDNGTSLGSGTATTGGRSGSFEVERHAADLASKDVVTLTASYAGQTCSGTATFS